MVLFKYIKRLQPIISNAVFMLLPSFANLLLSVIVINKSSSNLWGEIVSVQIYFYMITAITMWGNKESLLLQFSRQSQIVTAIWQQSFISRSLYLLIPLLLLTGFLYPNFIGVNICIWIVSRFFTQSMESVFTFNKKYNATLVAEIIALFPLVVLFIDRVDLNVPNIMSVLSISYMLRFLVQLVNFNYLFKNITLAKPDWQLLKQTTPFMLLALCGFLQTKSDLYCISFFSHKAMVGDYQVLTSYTNLFLLVPGFLMIPYTKNIYRMGTHSLQKFKSKVLKIGLLLGSLHIVVTYIIIEFIYGLSFSMFSYALVFVYIVLPFFYIINIYKLYKQNAQRYVMQISYLSIGVNLLVCVLLIPMWGINGALIANLVSQLVLFIFYHFNIKLGIKTYFNDRRVISFYNTLIPTGALCFDGGANIGKRTKVLLEAGYKVIAIEPQPECINTLQKLQTQYKGLTVMQNVLSTQNETLTMFVSNVNEVSTLSKEFIEVYSYQKYINWNQTLIVKAITLDSLIADKGMPFFCKLDLENHELAALKGLTQCIPLISFEFNKPLMHNSILCIDYLSALGNYEFNVSYKENFILASKNWLNKSDMIVWCNAMPADILTGEIFARLVIENSTK
ncbi:MAG: FkbM family methyltransferase [Bacteroidota bacterium]